MGRRVCTLNPSVVQGSTVIFSSSETLWFHPCQKFLLQLHPFFKYIAFQVYLPTPNVSKFYHASTSDRPWTPHFRSPCSWASQDLSGSQQSLLQLTILLEQAQDNMLLNPGPVIFIS